MATWSGIVVSVILLIIVLTLVSGLVPRRVPPRHESREARSEALQSVADELGVSFDPKPDNSVLEDLLQTQTFLDIRLRSGEPARKLHSVRNLLERHDEDLVLRAMDYQDIALFLNEAGDWEQEQTIAVFQTKRFDLPRLHAVLLPKGRVASLLGRRALRHWASQESHWKDWQIVDVAGNDRVARQYVFRAPDEDAARHVLSNDLLAILADSSVSFEAFGSRLIFWQTETHVAKGVCFYSSSHRERLILPEDIPSFLSECREIVCQLSKSN
jgi:hypothetical protein